MKEIKRTSNRNCYSDAFKRKVVSDINQGHYNAWQARTMYNILGKSTVYKWLAKYNKCSALVSGGGKMSKQQQKSSTDLEARVRYLEQIVSDLTIEKKILETTIELANKMYGLDLKKNSGKASLSNYATKTTR